MPVEDFTTYFEFDLNSRITKTATRVTWANLTRNELAKVTKAVDFSGDFIHEITVYCDAIADTGSVYFWVLSNGGDITGGGDYLAMSFRRSGSTYGIRMSQRNTGGDIQGSDGYNSLALDTIYYLRIVRDESVGTHGTLYCYIYSDAARTILVDTLELVLADAKYDFSRIFACGVIDDDNNAASSGYSENLEFILVELPTVTNDPATDVAGNSSTLNGTLDDDGGEACDCGFEWGETVAYGNTTSTQSKETGETFLQAISGLDPATTYHFRTFATNEAGTSYSADRTFTTLAVTSSVTTDPATGVGMVLANLNGTLDDDGGEACDCGFQWGETVAYGNTTSTQSKETGETFLQAISGLTHGTTYHFRAFSTNASGTSYGADQSFTTAEAISRGFALGRHEL